MLCHYSISNIKIGKKGCTLIGQTVLGYTIEKEIGTGRFGTVYKARKKNQSGTFVRALKHISLPTVRQYTDVLNSMGGDYSKTDDYFISILHDIVSEIQILNDLNENGVRNVVCYYENHIEERRSPLRYDIYILMELLTPLPEYMLTNELRVRDVIRLGKDICSVLIECHKNRIIHRDIKEDNIFVTVNGMFKLGDFGVSKKLIDSSRTESLKGTPIYIAPEVYLGNGKYDDTIDIYSLGIVLYRLFNHNRSPFLPEYPKPYNSNDEDIAFERRIKGELPPMPDNVNESMGKVILKAITPRESRYNDAEEFYSALIEAEALLSNDELNNIVVKGMSTEYTGDHERNDQSSPLISETIHEEYVTQNELGQYNGMLFKTYSEKYESLNGDENTACAEKIQQKEPEQNSYTDGLNMGNVYTAHDQVTDQHQNYEYDLREISKTYRMRSLCDIERIGTKIDDPEDNSPLYRLSRTYRMRSLDDIEKE